MFVRAILLAAGLGTRLHPLTTVVPKCLMPINGRPLLEYWLRNLKRAGISEVLVNTHHLPGLVRDWLAASSWGEHVHVTYEQELLGTAGTLLSNRGFYNSEPVLLAHADNLCDAPLRQFMAAHQGRKSGAVITMMSFVTDSPRACGILDVGDGGIVRAFHEKVPDPPGNIANGAVYIVDPEVVDCVASLGKAEADFSTEVIPRYLGRIQAWQNPGYHRDIGTVESLLAAQREYCDEDLPPARDAAAWAGLCENGGARVAHRLAMALGEALGAPVSVGDAEFTTGIADHGLIFVRGAVDAPGLQRLADRLRAGIAKYIVILEKAPPGFCARKTREHSGLTCFAVSQASTSNTAAQS